METFIRTKAGKLFLLANEVGDSTVRFSYGGEQCDDCGYALDDPDKPAQYTEHGTVVVCPNCCGRYYVQQLGASCC